MNRLKLKSSRTSGRPFFESSNVFAVFVSILSNFNHQNFIAASREFICFIFFYGLKPLFSYHEKTEFVWCNRIDASARDIHTDVGHFTVVCLESRPLNIREAGGDYLPSVQM